MKVNFIYTLNILSFGIWLSSIRSNVKRCMSDSRHLKFISMSILFLIFLKN